MNIQRISASNNTNPAFSSKLVPNNTLRSAFDHAKKTGDVKFLSAVKNILNDGKNNKIRVESYRNLELPHEQEYMYTKLFVNDKEVDFMDTVFRPPYIDKKNKSTGNRILDSIKLIVRNFEDKKQVRNELDEVCKKCGLDAGDTRAERLIEDKQPNFSNF